MNSVYYYDTIIGKLRIADNGKAITQIVLEKLCYPLTKYSIMQETSLIRQAADELQEYFEGKRREFTFPIAPEGTEFQKRDWAELQKIPYGEVRSYQQIAQAIECPKGARAVGLANNKNRIIIVIPCHRVLGSNGRMIGYAGGVDIKETLLRIEGVI